MSDIATTISMEITTLDPESALFVCTNCPTSVMKDTKKKAALIDKILNRIQMCWPMVVRSQIIFIDDMTQVSGFYIQLKKRGKKCLKTAQQLNYSVLLKTITYKFI